MKPARSLARALIGGIGLLTLGSLFARLLGLVSSPILTRVAGPEAYGVVALAGTLTSLSATVGLLGLDMAYARYYLSEQTDQGGVEAFSWRFSLGLGGSAAFCVALLWRFGPGRTSGGMLLPFLVGATTLLAVALAMATTRQRLQGRYGRMALATAAGALATTGCSVALVITWRPDASAMLTGTLLGTTLTLALLGLPPLRRLGRPSGLPATQRREVLKLGFASAMTAPMQWILSSTDRWFLDAFWGREVTGIYAFAASLGLAGMLVNTGMVLVWFPEVTRAYEMGGPSRAPEIARLFARALGLIMGVWLAVSALGGDALRLLADPRFHAGAPLIPWMAGGVFFAGLGHLANTGPFLQKNLNPTVAWWIASAVAGVVFQAALVPSYGAQGAAVATVGAYALLGGGLLATAQARLRLPLPGARLVMASGATLGMGLLLAPPWEAHPGSSLMLKLPVLTLALSLPAIILAPDWVARVLRRIRPSHFRAS